MKLSSIERKHCVYMIITMKITALVYILIIDHFIVSAFNLHWFSIKTEDLMYMIYPPVFLLMYSTFLIGMLVHDRYHKEVSKCSPYMGSKFDKI